ncbi:MAG: phytanoyl-CoA dioxygenase family protein [SAR202 cluster bacterium]|jgi:hypothetical protein|nr:phytanoyl-CoA dioxygenase family protein [SAR202 cluster bacterium]
MLTSGQIAHFETFGFLVLKQLFTQEEAIIMKDEAEDIFDGFRADNVFEGHHWEAVQPFFERRPFLSMVPDDDRIYNIGVDLLGPDFLLEGTEGNLQRGDTPWHGGIPEVGSPRHIKIGFYLEPLARETGCLRVVPGSHNVDSPDLLAILRDRNYEPDFRPFGMAPADVPSFAIESRPGDVVVFTEDVCHASFGGIDHRHQHALVFMANPETDAEVAFVRTKYEKLKYGLRPADSYVHSARPRIRRMVSRLVEWGFETSSM